jgi:hypothetical protein
MTYHPWLFSSSIVLGITACSPEAATRPGSADPTIASSSATITAAGTWRLRASYPRDLWEAKSASVRDPVTGLSTLYVIGGRASPRNLHNVFTTVRAYAPNADTWGLRAPFPIRVFSPNGAVAINNRIYVAGGITSFFDAVMEQWRSRRLRSLFVYDPATNDWARLKDLPYPSSSGVSDTYGGQLYVATWCEGGAASCASGELLRYNPSTNQWMSLGPTPHDPAFAGGGFMGGKLYLVDNLGRTDIYDVAGKRWSTGPAALTGAYASCAPASATLQGKLYLVGCHLAGDLSGRYPMLVFDPRSGAWSQTAPTPITAFGHQWALSRVIVNGRPGLELVGGASPETNAQFLP